MGKMISRVENKVDDMSENGADEDVPAVSRMEEKKKINSLYDTIYRKISLTPDEEEFVANIKMWQLKLTLKISMLMTGLKFFLQPSEKKCQPSPPC